MMQPHLFTDIQAVNRDILTVWQRLAQNDLAHTGSFITASPEATAKVVRAGGGLDLLGSTTMVLFRPATPVAATLAGLGAPRPMENFVAGEDHSAASRAKLQLLMLWKDLATRAPRLAAIQIEAPQAETDVVAGLPLAGLQHLASAASFRLAPSNLLARNLERALSGTERVKAVLQFVGDPVQVALTQSLCDAR